MAARRRTAASGTPSPRSKARGLKVTLYPFMMMDVAAGNALPDPYGNPAQPAYPWRGRITCDPAPLLPDTADGTAAARTQVEAFCGAATPGQFASAGDTIHFSGVAVGLRLSPLRAAPCASWRRRQAASTPS